jgi:hypothetical protein
MHRRLPPAQVIIIHAWQIVMDERIGMHRLNCCRRPQRARLFYAVQAGGFQHQKCSQAFATLHRIPHGLRKLMRLALQDLV